ncbi:ABC transporter ATP-binding protein [Umezawaea sp. Da 62-37]|uniref:ABC transporter ATP-binding protein n=1 Tax=Umezawaea sp. Da 62-37 TaxID=3075927 RepID=UPI0028F724CF|nr:ABC transporter ATP-binding protein [Umezawaea sp. Da 62-37]WNV87946.1 ABC transporter ATP-binding protein [Umezawaea sp. Da 62-37]
MSALRVDGLAVALPDGSRALSGVSLSIPEGGALGVVGESGAGKTLLLRAVMGQLPPGVRLVEGSVHLGGTPLAGLSAADWRRVRGARLAHLPQAAAHALNPMTTVRRQVVETIRAHRAVSRTDARAEAAALVASVGLPPRVLDAYPHQLSGGMAQRAALATTIAAGPSVLLADEPTASLDPVTRTEIAELLTSSGRERGMALLLVSHDLGFVARACDQVAVLYAGKVVEHGPVREVIGSPLHPYTVGMVAALPDPARPRARLRAVDGVMPPPEDRPEGCPFATRCPLVRPVCAVEPELVGTGRRVACHVVAG